MKVLSHMGISGSAEHLAGFGQFPFACPCCAASSAFGELVSFVTKVGYTSFTRHPDNSPAFVLLNDRH